MAVDLLIEDREVAADDVRIERRSVAGGAGSVVGLDGHRSSVPG